MLKPITLTNIAELDDSRIATAFNHGLQRIVSDLKDRPGVGQARSVTLVVTAKPDTDAEGNLTNVNLFFDIKESIPKRSSRRYVAEVGRAGLHVNDMSPDNPAQRTIDETTPLKVAK